MSPCALRGSKGSKNPFTLRGAILFFLKVLLPPLHNLKTTIRTMARTPKAVVSLISSQTSSGDLGPDIWPLTVAKVADTEFPCSRAFLGSPGGPFGFCM